MDTKWVPLVGAPDDARLPVHSGTGWSTWGYNPRLRLVVPKAAAGQVGVAGHGLGVNDGACAVHTQNKPLPAELQATMKGAE